jgi:dUTP pyrophosphatase
MLPLRVSIRRVGPVEVPLPEYFSGAAAGMDLAAAVDTPRTLAPGGYDRIPCGFAIALPPGFEAQIRPRSGLAAKHGVTVLNAPGTIDSDYRGEVQVLLINHGAAPFIVERGMRVAQLVVSAVTTVQWEHLDTLPDTARSSGGFGHTGTRERAGERRATERDRNR